MRIAHLISSGGMFGAENVLLNLAQWFNQNGETVWVGALKDSRSPKLQVIDRAKALNLPVFVIDCRGRFDISAVLALKKFMKENKIEILHTHNYKSDVIGLLSAKLASIPIVSTAHGFTGVTKSVSGYEKLDRWILKKFFDNVIVVAETVLDDFHSPRKKIIANGLDISRFETNQALRQKFRAAYHISEDETLIGIVGRLSVEKNQELFIHAAHDFLRQEKNVKFVIVGNGPEEDKLKSLVMAYGLKKEIIFTGLIEDIVGVYQGLDIFTLTSNTEGIPLTILEAMASRTVVAATNVGGIPQIVFQRETGVLVEKNDKAGLVKVWQELVEDSNLREKLIKSAYEYVKNEFSQSVMAEKYLDCYRDVLSKFPHSNPLPEKGRGSQGPNG